PAADGATYFPVEPVSYGAGALEVGGPGSAIALEPDARPFAGRLAHYHQWNRSVAMQGATASGAGPGAQVEAADLLLQPGAQLLQKLFLQIDLDIRLAHANSSQ